MKTFNKKYCCGMEDKVFMAEGLRAGRGMEACAEAAFQVVVAVLNWVILCV